eukprot:7087-Pelagococcus_subviridis.AAC.1
MDTRRGSNKFSFAIECANAYLASPLCICSDRRGSRTSTLSLPRVPPPDDRVVVLSYVMTHSPHSERFTSTSDESCRSSTCESSRSPRRLSYDIALASFGEKRAKSACAPRIFSATASKRGGISRVGGLTVRRFRSTRTPHAFPLCAPLNVDGFQSWIPRSPSSRKATSAFSSSSVMKSRRR